MNDKKNVNYTNNDGAKYRYSASKDAKKPAPQKTEKIKEALTKRAVFWRTNRAFAILVLVAVVLLSSVWSIHRAVSRRADVVEKYYAGVESGATDIKKNIVKMRDYAVQLVSLNEALNPQDEVNSDYRAAIVALDKESATPFWSDTSAAKVLHDKSASVYNSIKLSNGAKSDVKAEAESIYDSIDNCYKKLGGDLASGYAEAAKEYNKVIGRFPVSLFGKDEAPLFD